MKLLAIAMLIFALGSPASEALASAGAATPSVAAVAIPTLNGVVSSNAWQARRRVAPVRRAPRRAVRRHHVRHHHYDDIRRTRRARTATRIAVGTTVRTLPAGCRTVVRRNVRYRQCGSTWYRPSVRGTDVVYVVVVEP